MKLKYLVAFSILLFFSFIAYFMISGLMLSSDRPNTASPTDSSVSSTAGKAVVLTEVELARHATPESCWLLIAGKVYDVTPFISEHPGGAERIIENCGKDATDGFESRGGEGTHTSTARTILSQYYIGDFGQTIAPAEGQ